MAFCKNCGTQLGDGDLFCQNCGTKNNTPNPDAGGQTLEEKYTDTSKEEVKQEISDDVLVINDDKIAVNAKENGKSGEKPKGNKKSQKKLAVGLGITAVVLVVVLAAVLIIKNMSKKVAVDECIKVEVFGYDSQGYAVISLDEEAFLECIAEAKGEELRKEGSKGRERQKEDWEYDELKELIEFTADKDTDLSNGDEIVIEISFDNEEAKEYGIKFVGETYTYKVKGLEELEEIDIFEDLVVEFRGTAPNAYVYYYYDGRELPYYGTFSADKKEELNIGDVVTITFEGEEELLKQGYKLTATSKEYICEKVDKYVENVEELTDVKFDVLKDDAKSYIEAYFAKNIDYLGYENLNYMGSYVLTKKNDQSYGNRNVVYMVYSVQVSSKETFSRTNEGLGQVEGAPVFTTQTVYMPVCYSNVMIKADGSLYYPSNQGVSGDTELKYNSWYEVDGYTDGSRMYNDLLLTQQQNYTYDVSEELKNFGESNTETTESAETAKNTGDYILPTSNSAYLTKSDLEGLTKEQIRLATNEIYARHGYIFEDQELQAYFEGKSWYQGKVKGSEFNASVFNEYELANKDLIVTYAEEKGYR